MRDGRHRKTKTDFNTEFTENAESTERDMNVDKIELISVK